MALTRKAMATATFTPADGGPSSRFLALLGHAVIETDDGNFGLVEQIASRDFPPTIESDRAGTLSLGVATATDLVEVPGALIAYAEDAGYRTVLTRFYVVGPDTARARAVGGEMARKWVLERLVLAAVSEAKKELERATFDAREMLERLRAALANGA